MRQTYKASALLAAMLVTGSVEAGARKAAEAIDTPIRAQAAQAPTYGEIIGICRLAFAEQIAGAEPKQATAALAAVAEEHRPVVALLCSAYEQGQADLLTVISGPQAKQTSI